VIEAAQAADVAPIIVEAYELSRRENEVTQLLARGAGTADIAHVHLAAQGARDYVNPILGKVGVSSRASSWPSCSPSTAPRCTWPTRTWSSSTRPRPSKACASG
jgi:DNA-binding CsgD family transcriptional regulator